MNQPIPITAVILSAGKSTRMGRLKQLIPIQGRPMLEIVIKQTLQFPFQHIIAVIGHEEKRIKASISISDERFSWVPNRNYSLGQSTSLKEAYHHCAQDAKGMLVFLGDQPCIKPKTISHLLKLCVADRQQSKYIIQPSYQDRPGHPVFISRAMFPYLEKLEGDGGAKRIFSFAEEYIYLPVDDEGVTFDIDTQVDYMQLKSKI